MARKIARKKIKTVFDADNPEINSDKYNRVDKLQLDDIEVERKKFEKRMLKQKRMIEYSQVRKEKRKSFEAKAKEEKSKTNVAVLTEMKPFQGESLRDFGHRVDVKSVGILAQQQKRINAERKKEKSEKRKRARTLRGEGDEDEEGGHDGNSHGGRKRKRGFDDADDSDNDGKFNSRLPQPLLREADRPPEFKQIQGSKRFSTLSFLKKKSE